MFRSRILVIWSRHIGIAGLLGLALVAGVLPAPAQELKDRFVEGEVLVAFRPDAPEWQREVAVRALGARVARRSTVLGYVKLALPAEMTVEDAVRRLTADRRVLWAEPNYIQQALDVLSPQDPYLTDAAGTANNQWGVFKTGVYSLWRQIPEGEQCGTIAIVDSGIWDYDSPHPDLAANILNGANDGFDYVDDNAIPEDAGANAGHGTMVAGVAAASANLQGITGVAPCAKFRVIRVLNCGWGGAGCEGNVDDIANGIRFAADKGSDVINLSLGGWSYPQAERNAVLYAIEKGCIVVAASGNDYASQIRYPARFPEVIAVGASNRSDQVTDWSNYGANLDVVAPGDSIWTTSGANSYDSVPGTSFATPFVSGVCALMGYRNPAIKQHEAEAWLRSHATSIHAERDGYGRIDYRKLEDWSDSPAHAPASHRNFAWEWLGADASNENAMSDPMDDDGVTNAAVDGEDEGVFPISAPKLPLIPSHLGPSSLLYSLSVGDHSGPRYGPEAAKKIYVEGYADWNANGVLYPTGGFAENPGTWVDDGKEVESGIAVLDEHLLGNPMMMRTRLSYGSPAGPSGVAEFGEVEDDIMLNIVEDFDVDLHHLIPGVFFPMSGWGLVSDPDAPFFTNHGRWHMAKGAHPPSAACTGAIETVAVMRTPPMDWREYTTAKLSFVYCHFFTPCPPGSPPDHCHVQIIRDGVPVETIPMPIGSGTMVKDLSAHVGSGSVEIHWIVETDWPGAFYVDDVKIWAYDDSAPTAVTNLTAQRTPGDPVLRLEWTDPEENGPAAPPSSNTKAEMTALRYSASPINNEDDWLRALPWTPMDVTGGGSFPQPGTAGTANSSELRVPSAHQAYYAAHRTGDEVLNISTLSNVPHEATLPSLAVTVSAGSPVVGAAPGDTASIEFLVTNTGNTIEQFKLETSDTRGWANGFLELDPIAQAIGILLEPNTSAPVTARAVVAGGANDGDVDTLTVRAIALSANGTVAAVASQTITVDAPTSGAEDPGIAGAPSLRMSGPNPFSDATEIRLVLSRTQPWEAQIYDIGGRLVRTLGRGRLDPGSHVIPWNGRDDTGSAVPAGVYMIRVRAQEAGGVVRIVKLD